VPVAPAVQALVAPAVQALVAPAVRALVAPAVQAVVAPAARELTPGLLLAVELVRRAPTATGRIVAVQLPGAADRPAIAIRAVAQTLPVEVDPPMAAAAMREVKMIRPTAPTVIVRPALPPAPTQRPLTAVRSPDAPEAAPSDRVPVRLPVGPTVATARTAVTGGSPAVAPTAAIDPADRRGPPIRAPGPPVDHRQSVRTSLPGQAVPAVPAPAMPEREAARNDRPDATSGSAPVGARTTGVGRAPAQAEPIAVATIELRIVPDPTSTDQAAVRRLAVRRLAVRRLAVEHRGTAGLAILHRVAAAVTGSRKKTTSRPGVRARAEAPKSRFPQTPTRSCWNRPFAPNSVH
jgi:hypothetical protein